MRRSVAATVPPSVLVAVAWLRLENGPTGGDGLVALVLALSLVLLPTLRLRLLALPWLALAAAGAAFGSPALDGGPRRGFLEHAVSGFGHGLSSFYDVLVPFAGASQPEMHGVLVLAVFGFTAALVLAVGARRPLAAVLVLLVAVGWPLALLPTHGLAYGALLLGAALWLLASLRTARPVPALVAAALVLAASLALSSMAAVAKDGVLAWQNWNPQRGSGDPVRVDYVWDANYAGVSFPEKKTTVLRVRGPQRSLYWRATTLDQFTQDRWIESHGPLEARRFEGPLENDPLLPAAAADPELWVQQEVEVAALADDHLVAATTPVALEAGRLGRLMRLEGGIFRRLNGGLERGQRYTVWSYAPRPNPKQLAAAAAEYPPALDEYLRIDRTEVPGYGSPGRSAVLEALFTDERQLALWGYRGVYRQAERLAVGARSPYGAVVAIEAWLRSTGGFTYDEQPPAPGARPPLAFFVDESRRGYCQHFAGAMTLMLRFLGIPSRVAAGFTSGSYSRGTWTVTDDNAHAWVEAWFPGYGWLSFDPTPGRGELGASYSSSSPIFNAGDAVGAAFGGTGVAGGPDPGGAGELDRLDALRERAGRRPAVAPHSSSTFWLVLLGALAAGAAFGGGKLAWRRLRYLGREPRGVAGAARRELVEFLADQGFALTPSASPQELHRLVHAELGVDGRPFARALAEARFGPPEHAAAAAASARQELRALLRRIRRGLSRMQRLRGFLALGSFRG